MRVLTFNESTKRFEEVDAPVSQIMASISWQCRCGMRNYRANPTCGRCGEARPDPDAS
jgi:hypothetical protein